MEHPGPEHRLGRKEIEKLFGEYGFKMVNDFHDLGKTGGGRAQGCAFFDI